MHGDENERVLRRQADPDRGGGKNDREKVPGPFCDGQRSREGVEELHPRLAESLRQDTADRPVQPPDSAAEKIKAHQQEDEQGEHHRAADGAAMNDTGVIRKAVPTENAEPDEDPEDAEDSENALGE